MVVADQVFGVSSPVDVSAYRTPREYFRATLETVAGRLTAHKKLVILLDGVDHLSTESGDRSLSWLPASWPKHVHAVFTTDTADALSMKALDNHVDRILRGQTLDDDGGVDGCFLKIAPLDLPEYEAIADAELTRCSRVLTNEQKQVCSVSTFEICLLHCFRQGATTCSCRSPPLPTPRASIALFYAHV